MTYFLGLTLLSFLSFRVHSQCPENRPYGWSIGSTCQEGANCFRQSGDSQYILAYEMCPCGKLFNERTKRCDHAINVRCSIDPCQNGIAAWSSGLHCRAYWVCKNRRSNHQACCSAGKYFNSQSGGCEFDDTNTCQGDCPCKNTVLCDPRSLGYSPGTTCDNYVFCKRQFTFNSKRKLHLGPPKKIDKVCPCNTLWDQLTRSCVPAQAKTCANDPCREPGRVSWSFSGHCRGYWVCHHSRTSHTECCQAGMVYDAAAQACIFDQLGLCAGSCPCNQACHMDAEYGDATKYFEYVNNNALDRRTHACASGKIFCRDYCQCVDYRCPSDPLAGYGMNLLNDQHWDHTECDCPPAPTPPPTTPPPTTPPPTTPPPTTPPPTTPPPTTPPPTTPPPTTPPPTSPPPATTRRVDTDEVDEGEDDGPETEEPGDDGPEDDGPEDDGPGDDGPGDDGPEDDGPGDDGPEDDGPEDDGPGDDGPGGDGPGDDGPEDDGPGDDGPGDDRPGDDGPGDDGPEDDGPEDDGPGDDGPGDDGPGEDGPGDDGPGDDGPGDDGPEDDGPGDDGPEDDGPGDDGPGDDGPGDDGPEDDGPGDDGPGDKGSKDDKGDDGDQDKTGSKSSDEARTGLLTGTTAGVDYDYDENDSGSNQNINMMTSSDDFREGTHIGPVAPVDHDNDDDENKSGFNRNLGMTTSSEDVVKSPVNTDNISVQTNDSADSGFSNDSSYTSSSDEDSMNRHNQMWLTNSSTITSGGKKSESSDSAEPMQKTLNNTSNVTTSSSSDDYYWMHQNRDNDNWIWTDDDKEDTGAQPIGMFNHYWDDDDN